jgi:sRNA-binding protein
MTYGMKTKTPRQLQEENELLILKLCKQYPKCFFNEPTLRRPLKNNILADIKNDTSFDHTPEQITAAVEWYQSHISYDYCCKQAGSKRVDLEGCEVAVVTELEAREAQQNIYRKQKDINERKAARGLERVANPVSTLNKMHADNRISDDIVKKQDAPMLHRNKTTATTAPEFAPLFEILNAANVTVIGSDSTMRATVAKMLLNKVIRKFQQVESEMEE